MVLTHYNKYYSTCLSPQVFSTKGFLPLSKILALIFPSKLSSSYYPPNHRCFYSAKPLHVYLYNFRHFQVYSPHHSLAFHFSNKIQKSLPFSPPQQCCRLVWMVAWPSLWAWPVRVAQWRVWTGYRVLAAWAPVSRHRWTAQSTSQACSGAWTQRSVHITRSKLSVCMCVCVAYSKYCMCELLSVLVQNILFCQLIWNRYIIIQNFYNPHCLSNKSLFLLPLLLCSHFRKKIWVLSQNVNQTLSLQQYMYNYYTCTLVTLKFRIVFRRAWGRSRPIQPDRNSQLLDRQGCTL